MNMRKIRSIVTVMLLVSVVVSCAALNVNAAGQKTDVSALIESFEKDTNCSSVSVCVFDGGETSFYGDQKGLYQIGSMTKAFTGLAIQKLISEGKISEDSKVSEFLDGYKAYYGSKPYEITIGNLLTQTSGYTNNETDYPAAEPGMTLKAWAYSISGKELKTAPGTLYAYSNVNFNLLGAIIETVTGKTYKDYMESEILYPLGLVNTYVAAPDDAPIIRGSRLGYRFAFEYEIPVSEGRIPAGYFYSNAEDMARWIGIWTGAVDVPDEFCGILNEVKSHLKEEGDYYSGWEVFGDGVIGHSGGTPNYSSRIVFSEKDKTGVCVLTNLNVASSTDSLCNGIFSLTVNGSNEGIAADVWTVFDIIFSIVSIAAILLAVLAAAIKKRGILIVLGIAETLIVILCLTILPAVFGAGLKAIFGIWAPYSMAGGVILLIADVIITGIRLLLTRNEDRKKTS